MKLNLTPAHLIELMTKGHSLDQVAMLKWLEEGIDFTPLYNDNVRLCVLHQVLVRKGLITDGDKLTDTGRALIVFIDAKNPSKIVKKKPVTGEFQKWWATFPGTDVFEWGGKKFAGSRALKVKQEDCRIKFDKILLEGDYTAEELIGALEYEIRLKKDQSVKLGENKLKYMHNSLTYLNQRDFEPFIDLIKTSKVKINPSEEPQIPVGTTDI